MLSLHRLNESGYDDYYYYNSYDDYNDTEDGQYIYDGEYIYNMGCSYRESSFEWKAYIFWCFITMFLVPFTVRLSIELLARIQHISGFFLVMLEYTHYRWLQI